MKMTMTQKILAAHATGRARSPSAPPVRPGELVMAKLDLVLGNDITAPIAIKEFPKFGCEHVFDREKVVLVPDHFTPNKDIKAAAQCAAMRAFARTQGIVNYFETGHDCGIEHALLPEKGPTRVPTARSARSPPASAPRTWQREWRLAKRGSAFRRQSRSCCTASRAGGLAART